MGCRVEKTIDLGLGKNYCIEIDTRCGIQIGKLHGIGCREEQQDAFGCSSVEFDAVKGKGILLVLSDGMGELKNGEKASAQAVVSCLNYFENHSFENMGEALEDSVFYVNQQVCEILQCEAGAGGATLIEAYIKDNRLYFASVGDSRIYLYRNGKLTQLSHDHNYGMELEEMVKNGEISKEEADGHPQRKALTSYIGLEELEQIDIQAEGTVLRKGDRVLLFSDGVFGTLTSEEICSAMRYTIEKSAIHIEMQIERKQKRGQDNYTAIMAEVI